MTDTQSFWILLIHAAVSVVVIVATTLLTYADKLDPSATTAIFGAAIGLVGGIQATQAVANHRNGKPPRVPPAETSDETPNL